MYGFKLEERILGKILEDRAERLGDQIFFQYKGQEPVSYGQMNEMANRFANSFKGLGIGQSENVCLMLPNCTEFLYCWLGLAKMGGVEVPINTAYKGDLLQYIINDAEAKVLIVHESFLDRIAFVANGLNRLEKIIILGQADGAGFPALNRFEIVPFNRLYETRPDHPEVEVDYSDLMAIMYTSGTTGPSKGVMVTHAHHISFATAWIRAMGYTKDDVLYTPLPFFHAIATSLGVIPVMLTGSRMVAVERFSVSTFWDDIHHFCPTVSHVVFSIPQILLGQPPRPDDRDNTLRAMYIAQANPEFEERFGVKLVEVYGATENGVVTSVAWGEEKPVNSCGREAEFFEVKIFDDNDNELGPGEVGEFVCRPKEPYALMLGYYNKPEATVEAFRNLWFHTGDQGYTDAEGYFYFADRKKDALRRRGENISSYEVEKVINSHPSVLESAVIAVPSEVGEDEVKACIVLKSGVELAPEELIAYCQDRMPYFMVPRFIEFMEALPKTPNEKIEKYKLRQAGNKGITEKTWDRVQAGIEVKR